MPPAPVAAPAARASLGDELIAAACTLRDTLAGRHLDESLVRVLAGSARALPAASRAPVRDMTYAAVRQLGLLRALAARVNARPPAPLLGALQLLGLAQLADGRRADAIVVDQAVAAARRLPEGAGHPAAAGFLNATLRRFVRERTGLLAAVADDPEARWNLPAWWVDAVRDARPADWSDVLTASRAQAPLTLRVNRRGGSVQAASERLAAAGHAHRRVGAEALVLDAACPVGDIPGFADGLFTVQDAGAQLSAPGLAPRAGERILDACAAPGGKTTHLLQLADCAVLALDVDAARLARVAENLARERLPQQADWPPQGWGAHLRVADAAEPSGWWDGTPFDKILVDAPCSASGIVGRHPDVPWHRRRRDLATFADQQQRLLDALWPLLKPGGTLLYVTCSIFPEEGEAVIARFCSRHPSSRRLPLVASWPDGDEPVTQLVPTRTIRREHDGFFHALLSRQP